MHVCAPRRSLLTPMLLHARCAPQGIPYFKEGWGGQQVHRMRTASAGSIMTAVSTVVTLVLLGTLDAAVGGGSDGEKTEA